MFSLKKVIAPITTFIALLLFSQVITASQNDVAINKINQAIQQKLDFYNKTFPEIQFVHLKNGEWEKSLQALELFIGYQATNLDYEHPADLREALLFATLEKISMMLINGIPSSYLFRVGEMPAAIKKHVCVITLNPMKNVSSNQVATQSFIDLPGSIITSLPEEKYLDKKQHLDFIIDHEVFHCLDTFNFGGIPMSENTFSTQHTCFMRESQADMFAIAMHIKRQRKITPYVKNIIIIRGMTLLNGDCQHNSTDAIQLVTNSNIEQIISSSSVDLLSKVKNDYKNIAPDYDQFMIQLKASIEAMKKLGIKPIEIPGLSSISEEAPDNKQVKNLIDRTYYYYEQYTGKKYPLSNQ